MEIARTIVPDRGRVVFVGRWSAAPLRSFVETVLGEWAQILHRAPTACAPAPAGSRFKIGSTQQLGDELAERLRTVGQRSAGEVATTERFDRRRRGQQTDVVGGVEPPHAVCTRGLRA